MRHLPARLPAPDSWQLAWRTIRDKGIALKSLHIALESIAPPCSLVTKRTTSPTFPMAGLRLAAAQQLGGQRIGMPVVHRVQRCSLVRSTGGVRCQAGKGFGKTSQPAKKPVEVSPCGPFRS